LTGKQIREEIRLGLRHLQVAEEALRRACLLDLPHDHDLLRGLTRGIKAIGDAHDEAVEEAAGRGRTRRIWEAVLRFGGAR
jgi:hypothetical protein